MMIGTGPYDSQSGGLAPSRNSYIPGAPPESLFLNSTSQAWASVQEGMM